MTWLSGKKKITNIKLFLIHPPSCSPPEQNSCIVPWGLLRPELEPVREKEGSCRPSAQLLSGLASCSHPVGIQT